MKLYQSIASLVNAIENCQKNGNGEWEENHTSRIEREIDALLPSGSGIDSGSNVNISESEKGKIVIDSSFHKMNDDGYYDGWVDFKVVVTACLTSEISLDIVGLDAEDDYMLGDYLYDVFKHSLTQEI